MASWICAFLALMAAPVSAPAVCMDERAANASIARSDITIAANKRVFFLNLPTSKSSGFSGE